MTDPKSQPRPSDKTEQRKPRNPGNPTDGQRQELDPQRGSQSEGNDKRDSFSGETMPKH